MAKSRFGFSTKVITVNLFFLLIMGATQALVVGMTSKAISITRSQGHRIEQYNTMNLMANQLGEIRYWLADLALTWDMASIDKAKTSQKKLTELLDTLRVDFPEEVAAIEKKVNLLFDKNTDAVTSFATGDRDAGTKLIKDARTINDEINTAMAKVTGDKQEKGTVVSQESPTEQIISEVSKISRMFWLNFGLLLLSVVFLAMFTNRSIVLPIRRALLQFKGISLANLKVSLSLSGSSQKSSTGVSEQASAIQETVATLNEISAMVNRTVEIAGLSAQKADVSFQIANEGKSAVDKMREAMRAIRTAIGSIIEQSNASNRRMGETVSIIDKIVERTNVINDIVFQTKLLSFNASVEAARAGENGKGFAVVAEEVGNLARMSGQASQEIGELLRTSRQDVAKIVHQSEEQAKIWMKDGMDKVETGAVIADRCEEILTEVVEHVGSVMAHMGEISAAAKEGAEGINNISSAMNMLDSTTHLNSDMAHQTMGFARTLSEQSQRLSVVVEELTVMVLGTKLAQKIADETPDESTKTSKKEPSEKNLALVEEVEEEDYDFEDEDEDEGPTHTKHAS